MNILAIIGAKTTQVLAAVEENIESLAWEDTHRFLGIKLIDTWDFTELILRFTLTLLITFVVVHFICHFGTAFEEQFLRQGDQENRSIEETLEIGWRMLSLLPKDELYRICREDIQRYYMTEDEPAVCLR